MVAAFTRAAKQYRRTLSKFGALEGILHAFLLTYTVLLFVSALLNLCAPDWASRRSVPIPPAPPRAPPAHTVGRCLSRGLLDGPLEDPVLKRVRAEFDCGCTVPAVYEEHETPTVCAIVQSFNHRKNIRRIAKSLKENPNIQEIIVCEDGSTDGSAREWANVLNGTRHFVVLSNNLHETRCYNRAMRMTSAEYFILLQDDDLPPEEPLAREDTTDGTPPNWVSEALELFDADPKVGVLTGFIGQIWEPRSGKGYEFGEQQSDHGGTRKGPTRRIPFLSKRTLKPFMYVECAWIAPVFIRARALHRIGGLDVGLFKVREPGVWQDCVLSYAAWTAGWRVGVFDAGFRRGVGGHGSTSSKKKTAMRGVVWKKAKKAVDERYDRPYIHARVIELNDALLTPRYSNDTGSS